MIERETLLDFVLDVHSFVHCNYSVKKQLFLLLLLLLAISLLSSHIIIIIIRQKWSRIHFNWTCSNEYLTVSIWGEPYISTVRSTISWQDSLGIWFVHWLVIIDGYRIASVCEMSEGKRWKQKLASVLFCSVFKGTWLEFRLLEGLSIKGKGRDRERERDPIVRVSLSGSLRLFLSLSWTSFPFWSLISVLWDLILV